MKKAKNTIDNTDLMIDGILIYILSIVPLLLIPVSNLFIKSVSSSTAFAFFNIFVSLIVLIYGIAKSAKLSSGTLLLESIILPIVQIITVIASIASFCVNSSSCPEKTAGVRDAMTWVYIISAIILTLFFILTLKKAKKG